MLDCRAAPLKEWTPLVLAVFQAGVYRGRYDSTGWHAATDRRRIRHLRSYQLPLVA